MLSAKLCAQSELLNVVRDRVNIKEKHESFRIFFDKSYRLREEQNVIGRKRHVEFSYQNSLI